MKTIFRKPQPVEESPVSQEPRSRFQLILDEYKGALDDFKSARHRLDRASHYLSTLMLDAEKGINYIEKFVHDITEAMHEEQVPIDSDIEEQIADFLPKHVKTDGQAQKE